EEGRRQLRQQGPLPASWFLVRPPRLRLPNHRHHPARRDRGPPPRDLLQEHVVVGFARLHPRRRRGLELHSRHRLPAEPPRGRRRSHRRLGPLRRRRLQLVGRRSRRARQGSRSRRRHHQHAQPRRRRLRGGPLRLHVPSQRPRLGLRHGFFPRGSPPTPHLEYRQGPHIPPRRRRRRPPQDPPRLRSPRGRQKPWPPDYRGPPQGHPEPSRSRLLLVQPLSQEPKSSPAHRQASRQIFPARGP
ncbi:uncharacterized protein METZ01_LOCUS478324, partial [marine metagenome]